MRASASTYLSAIKFKQPSRLMLSIWPCSVASVTIALSATPRRVRSRVRFAMTSSGAWHVLADSPSKVRSPRPTDAQGGAVVTMGDDSFISMVDGTRDSSNLSNGQSRMLQNRDDAVLADDLHTSRLSARDSKCDPVTGAKKRREGVGRVVWLKKERGGWRGKSPLTDVSMGASNSEAQKLLKSSRREHHIAVFVRRATDSCQILEMDSSDE
eukprot:4776283-Pleurochrysis_carterae.AAC.4